MAANTTTNEDLETLTEVLQSQVSICEGISKTHSELLKEQEDTAKKLIATIRDELSGMKKEEQRMIEARKSFDMLKQKYILEGKEEADHLISLAKNEADEIAKNIVASKEKYLRIEEEHKKQLQRLEETRLCQKAEAKQTQMKAEAEHVAKLAKMEKDSFARIAKREEAFNTACTFEE